MYIATLLGIRDFSHCTSDYKTENLSNECSLTIVFFCTDRMKILAFASHKTII